jgi:hypothetical protein
MAYTDVAASLPADATWGQFRQATLQAVVMTLVESGSDPNEIGRLLLEGSPLVRDVDKNARWTSECNARRIALIDKMIQQTLSAEEAAELGRLTARLRLHVDNEELSPIEGARRLYRRLLETDSPGTSEE